MGLLFYKEIKLLDENIAILKLNYIKEDDVYHINIIKPFTFYNNGQTTTTHIVTKLSFVIYDEAIKCYNQIDKSYIGSHIQVIK